MRKLASIRRISHITPIKGADLIECAHVDGWMVVIKKGEFKEGELCVYLEVDAWVPYELAPFLTPKDQEVQEFNGVKGNRLRTVKLRNQLSQGLLLSINTCFPNAPFCLVENQDVTSLLGIQKWERPLPPELVGKARGTFPTLVSKTSLERIQNLTSTLPDMKGYTWCVTEKLDGMSSTKYLDMEGVFHVCSAEVDLLPDEGNVYWQAAHLYDLERLMVEHKLHGIAIQGEIVGPGIRKNVLGLPFGFYVFSMYQVEGGTYLQPSKVKAMCSALGLKHVPILHDNLTLQDKDINSLIQEADGPSRLNPGVQREGMVFRSNEDPNKSFKVISNKWLLKSE